MKLIIIASLLFVCASAFTLEQDDQFKTWMLKHGREYASNEEFLQRMSNYFATEARFEELHQTYGANFGHNQFSDMTVEEFESLYLPQKTVNADGTCRWPYSETLTAEDFAGLPRASSFDWRDQTPNPVTEVKDQGACGSCWSFSTTGNIEGQWILAGNPSVTLSEQQIVDCSHSCLASEPSLCNAGCGGGLPWLAYNDIKTWGGLTSESEYPYTGMDGSCQTGKTIQAKISSWSSVSSDLATIETALQNNGPISITLNANPLMSYQSGVITGSATSCPGYGADHAVLLVGYGDDTDGTHYWIVKNSWNQSWGEDGFFRMQADDSTDLCGILDCPTSTSL